jgi:hypothetical protein
MLLREVDIDAPELPREQRASFRFSVRSLAALFQRTIAASKLKADGWKVLVDFVREPKRSDVLLTSGVYVVQMGVDIAALDALAPRERNLRVLEALARGFDEVARQQGWPSELGAAARQAVLDLDFRNVWTLGKPSTSPDGKYRAELRCEHLPSAFHAHLVVHDRKGHELRRKLAVDALPDEMIFGLSLGKVAWVSPTRVRLTAKNGSEVAALDLAEDS